MTNTKSQKKTVFSFTLLVLLFLTVVVFAFYRFKTPNEHAAPPEKVNVSIPVRVINLDTAARNNDVSATFRIYNVDKALLRIKEVRPDCFCTTTTASKNVIEPGDSAEIKLTFKYTDRDYGYFQKSAFVESNAAKNPILLTIRGYLQKMN